jgi:YVTN family beta-propeller protein
MGVELVRILLALASLGLAAPASAAPLTYSVVGSYKAADGGWDILSVDPVAHRLYVARRDSVTAVDLATGTVTDKLAPADGGHSALVIPGTSDVLVTNGTANTATIIDGGSGQRRATIATGKKPDAAVYDPATRTVWVMDPGDGTATVIDPVTAKAVATVPVGGSLEFAAADGRGRLYVNAEDKNDIAVIDTRTRKVLRREPLLGCDGPTGIVYDPATRETLSACANGIAILLSDAGKLLASLAIGKRPDGAVLDGHRHVALVPSGADGTLSVIQLSPAAKVISTTQTAKSARTIALDPSTGRVYLPATDLLPAVDGERPKAIPGTFRIIVVAPSS